MKTIKIVLALLEIAASVFFLLNIANDIQFGFGLVLLFGGLKSLLSL